LIEKDENFLTALITSIYFPLSSVSVGLYKEMSGIQTFSQDAMGGI